MAIDYKYYIEKYRYLTFDTVHQLQNIYKRDKINKIDIVQLKKKKVT